MAGLNAYLVPYVKGVRLDNRYRIASLTMSAGMFSPPNVKVRIVWDNIPNYAKFVSDFTHEAFEEEATYIIVAEAENKVDIQVRDKDANKVTQSINSNYINYFNMAFTALNLEPSSSGELTINLVEFQAYDLSLQHSIFAMSHHPEYSPVNIIDSYYSLGEYIDKLTDGLVTIFEGTSLPDSGFDDDYRSRKSKKSSPIFRNYYKPEGLSVFQAVIMEARRYGYALSYQPEYGNYFLKDIIIPSFVGADNFDNFLAETVIKKCAGGVEANSYSQTTRPFHVQNADAFFFNRTGEFATDANNPEKRLLESYCFSYEAGTMKELNDANGKNIFEHKYCHLAGVKYQVNEGSLFANKDDNLYSGKAIPAVVRRLMSDIQVNYASRNSKSCTINIPLNTDVLKLSVLSRFLAFIGYQTMCYTSSSPYAKKFYEHYGTYLGIDQNENKGNFSEGMKRIFARRKDQAWAESSSYLNYSSHIDKSKMSSNPVEIFKNNFNNGLSCEYKQSPDILTNVIIALDFTGDINRCSVQLILGEQVLFAKNDFENYDLSYSQKDI